MSLGPAERERYSRHLLLPEIGAVGQEKLKAARVLVIGAGGLGSPASQFAGKSAFELMVSEAGARLIEEALLRVDEGYFA